MSVVYDMHAHTYELKDDEIEDILARDRELVIVSVSDDPKSIVRTYELSRSYDQVIPCAGYHPWNFREGGSLEGVMESIRLAERLGVTCIGEVGLDRKFLPDDTWDIQVEAFKKFIELTSEVDGFLNIHSPGAWRDVLDMISGRVERAMLHWYTGPLDLIPVVKDMGYYISINPAIRIQEKHRRVAEYAPLDVIVFESDSPYNYRGLRLSPLMVRESIRIVASIKGVDPNTVLEYSVRNSSLLLGSPLG